MPVTTSPRRSAEDLERLGTEILHVQIEPLLSPKDMDKFIAIAVDSADYELHEDDFAAVSRLLARHPKAEVWLAKVGQPAAYRIGSKR